MAPVVLSLHAELAVYPASYLFVLQDISAWTHHDEGAIHRGERQRFRERRGIVLVLTRGRLGGGGGGHRSPYGYVVLRQRHFTR